MAHWFVVAFAALALSASAGPESTASWSSPREQAHEEAQKAHDAAFSHAERATEKAQAWLGALGDRTAAKALAEAIAADTERGAAVAASGREGEERTVTGAEAMRVQLKDLEEDKKSQAKELTKDAKDAAHAAAHASKELEKTARHAGVSEKHYEGDYGHDEHAFEKFEDKSGDMKDKAQDKIEKFFEKVERALEPRMDAARHQRLSHAEEEEDRKELEAAEEHPQEEVKKLKEAARAAKKTHEEKITEAEKEANAEKKAEAEKEKKQEAEAKKKTKVKKQAKAENKEEAEEAEAKKEARAEKRAEARKEEEEEKEAEAEKDATPSQERKSEGSNRKQSVFLAAAGTAPGPAAPAVALFLLAALAAYAMVPPRRTVGMAPPLLG